MVGRRKWHNDQVKNICGYFYNDDKIKENGKRGVSLMQDKDKNVYRAIVGKPSRKKSTQKTQSQMGDNNTRNMDFKETVMDEIEWIHLAQDSDQ